MPLFKARPGLFGSGGWRALVNEKTPVEHTIGVTDVLPRFDEKKKNRTKKCFTVV